MIPDRTFEVLLRLAGATLALLEWHTINGKGNAGYTDAAGRDGDGGLVRCSPRCTSG